MTGPASLDKHKARRSNSILCSGMIRIVETERTAAFPFLPRTFREP